MIEWIVYYDTGLSFSSDDGPPESAPKDGVQIVAQRDVGTGRLLWHSYDYYCWHKEGHWLPHTERGLKHYLSKADEPGIYIAGYWMSHKAWDVILNTAADDPRLPPKTATDPREKEADSL